MTCRRHFPNGYAVRLLAGGLALTFLAAAVAGLSAADDAEPKKADDPAAKSQRPPEDEDPNAKPVKTHKVSVDEPDDVGPKAPAAPRAVDLAEAAKDAKQEDVKRLFRALADPHDVVKYVVGPRRKQNVAPIPDYIGTDRDALPDTLTITPFSSTSRTPDAPISVNRNGIDAVIPYEELALEAVNEFLGKDLSKSADPQMVLSRYDQDVAAEQVLTAVLLFHQSAKERGRRRGDGWRPVEDALKKKLLDVLLDELKQLTEANPPDWDAAFALTKRLAETYHGEQDRERIAAPLTGLAKKALLQKESGEKQKEEARRRSLLLADLFPRSQVIAPVTDALHEQAKLLFDEAKQEKNPERMGRLLNEAAEAWPALPDLRTFRLEQNKATLRVGVRELPTRMSPASAVSDSDLRAVELQFESLMKLSPDGAGGCRWEPELAEGRPRMTPRGREFRLPENACWSNGDFLRAIDVRSTVERLKAGKAPRRPRVWADLLDDVNVADPTRVSLTLRQGWLDPLAPMNFKVLPSGPDTDSEQFAKKPVGSGPFVYGGTGVRPGDPNPCAYFTANPNFGARPGKGGLPRLHEIRLYTYTNAMKEARRFDLILDLTAKEAADLREKAPALDIRRPPAAVPNRRIYFLAVNHRKPALANAAFRCALAYAIDRTGLLDECFRAKKGQDLHTPLNGPYPAKSWAANPGLAPKTVVNAKAKMDESGLREVPALSLKYPLGDPAVKDAMEKLCEAMKDKDSIGVTLTPEGESEEQLHKDVEDTHNYDLAYYHYDYPDDVYWLGPLLDPAGDNYLDYHGGLAALVRDESRRRDFAEVQARAHELHDRFLNQEMPFIPLWQLDPLAAVSNGVVAPPFDPLLVFTDAERWKLK